jgi:hypothetical protein
MILLHNNGHKFIQLRGFLSPARTPISGGPEGILVSSISTSTTFIDGWHSPELNREFSMKPGLITGGYMGLSENSVPHTPRDYTIMFVNFPYFQMASSVGIPYFQTNPLRSSCVAV